MNIWAWVGLTQARLEQGEPPAQRLAELIDALPSATVDEAHERLDAMTLEALALARELDEPWVELFVRHWSLQSRVLHRRQAGEELREAVSLLDFASAERTRACPQSVCAVQDLAVCYAIRDGPGYVQERLAVARETLTRIDPSWACFDCISAEYFSALMDDDQPGPALAFVEAQIAQLAEHGQFELGTSHFNIATNRVRALAALGQVEQALALLDAMPDPTRGGRSRQISHRLTRTSLLLELGRTDEALALHPRLSAIRASAGHFRSWVENLAGLVDRGAIPNTAALGSELLWVQRRLEQNGARWDTATTALIGARLALARAVVVVPELLLADFDRVAPSLRRPELLAARRRELGEALARARTVEGPFGRGESLERLDHTERALDLLALARREQPEDPELALDHAAALRELGRPDMARALLERQAGSNPRATIELAWALLAEHDHGALAELVAGQLEPAEHPAQILAWIYGESLRAQGDLAGLIALDQRVLSADPKANAMRARLAATARNQGDWATTLAALDALAASAEQQPTGEVELADLAWDRLTAATVLGRWATVRAITAQLGLALPGDHGQGDEPMDLDLGLIRCEFLEADGRRQRLWARRSSPCSAVVLEISMPGDPQRYLDRVAIEPLCEAPELDGSDDSEAQQACFEVVAVLESGRHRAFLLRGFDPGADRLELLSQGVRAAGYGFERITAEGRTTSDPREHARADALVPTLGLLVAIPQAEDPARLRALLAELIANWDLPLLDPKLEAAAGEPEAAARARALLDRWKP